MTEQKYNDPLLNLLEIALKKVSQYPHLNEVQAEDLLNLNCSLI